MNSTEKLLKKIYRFQLRQRFEYHHEKLTDSDVKLLIDEIIQNKQCTMLWLIDNQLNAQGISLLATSLNNTNVVLDGLSLCQNQLTDDDVFQLSSAFSMKTCRSTRLALTSNRITDRGVQYLADMLKINTSLQQLWLGSNEITNKGLCLLIDVLRLKNRTLKVLSLSHHPMITDQSRDALLDLLDQNQSLKMLCLVQCHLSETCQRQLHQAAQLHKEFYFDF